MEGDPQVPNAPYARQVIRASERAMERATVAVHEDFKRGLNPLATIASTAPFIGIFGTVWAISFDTFVGFNGPKSMGLASVTEGLSRACIFSALGLAVGLQAFWCYSYFRRRIEQFDLEMRNACLKLLNQLTLQVSMVGLPSQIEPFNGSVPYLEAYSPSGLEDGEPWRYSSPAAVALLVFAWFIQVVRYFNYDFLPLNSAIPMGFGSVLILFWGLWLAVWVVWVVLLRRKSSGLLLVATALCFSRCAAGLLFQALGF